MPASFGFIALVAVCTVVALEIVYWIIRLAVRHGIQDAQRRA
jgi:hypothetical protein